MSSSTKQVSLKLLVILQGAISAASLVVEIVAGRMLAPYVGMSLYTWTSVIAVVLAGFSAGHWWGGRIAERPIQTALSYTGWLILAAALSTAVAVVLLRVIAEPIMNAVENQVWTIAILTMGVFFLPSLFAGVPAPVLAQIAVTGAKEKSGRALGAIFAAGALGAIGGTLLAGFFFIPWLGTAATLAIVTATYLVAAFIIFVLSRHRAIALAPLAVAALALGLSAVSVTRLSPCTHESQYYCIRVIDVSSDPSAPVRRMVLDHLSHGTSARDVPRVMFTQFTAMLDAIARGRMGDRQFSTFFIGGGTYAVPRAWVDRQTGDITVAEIDPAVTRSAIDDFWLKPDKINIIPEDARSALLTRPSVKYDVIIGDAFSDIAVPDHLITQEFFQLISSRLNKGGVYLMNIIDYPERLQALAAVYATVSTVFPSVEVWTQAKQPEPGKQRVFVLAAGSGPTKFSFVDAPAPQLTRFAALGEEFYQQVLKQRSNLILTDDYAPIDRLLLPGS